MNTVKQGDIGVAAAIFYFTKLLYAVSKPLADSQRYDLVVDNGKVQRVECKTTGTDRVDLRTLHPLKRTYVNLSSKEVELLFVYHLDGRQWLIPVKLVEGQQSLTLKNKWDKWRVD